MVKTLIILALVFTLLHIAIAMPQFGFGPQPAVITSNYQQGFGGPQRGGFGPQPAAITSHHHQGFGGQGPGRQGSHGNGGFGGRPGFGGQQGGGRPGQSGRPWWQMPRI